MKGKNLAIVFCFLLSLASGQYGIRTPEGYLAKTFTREDGLPYNHVLSISQDQTGFLWIGTWDGLSRYDGYDFKNYYYKPDDSTSLPYIVINMTQVDLQNNLWISSAGSSLTKYNRAEDNFERPKFRMFNDSIEHHYIFQTDRNLIMNYFPREHKIISFDLYKNQFSSLTLTLGKGVGTNEFWSNVRFIMQSNDGYNWFYTWHPDHYDIFRGEKKNDSILFLQQLNSIQVNPARSGSQNLHGNYFNVFKSEKGNTWLFSSIGIFKLDTLQNRFQPFTGQIVPSEFKEKSFCYWYDDFDNVHIIDPLKNKYVVLKSSPGYSVFTVLMDRSHNIWYSQESESRVNMGLIRLCEVPVYFKHYLTGTDKYGNLRPVFAITMDSEGDIWAGTRGAGYIYRVEPDGRETKVSFSSLFPGREAPKARSLASDPDGVWIGCTNNFLVFYNKRTGTFRKWELHISGSEGKSKSLDIHNIVKDSNDIIISGAGVYRFNPATGNLSHEYSYPNDYSFSFIKDAEEGYLAGISGMTVIRLDSTCRETSRYTVKSGGFFQPAGKPAVTL
jgi:ligand-binding sensor domain-containing protein